MKKKIILMVSTFVCMLALCSCGNNKDELNGLSEEQLQAACEQTAEVLIDLDAAESEEYYAYYASQEEGAIYADLMEQWIEIQPQIGEFVGYKEFEAAKSGKTITATETITFTERDIKLTYVISTISMEPTAVNVEIVYGLGETMSKAGLNTVMAMGIVFSVLIMISLIISCFKYISVIQNKLTKKEENPVKETEAPAASVVTTVNDDTELIAVIAAAIAASTGTSTDDFVVRSIKRRY